MDSSTISVRELSGKKQSKRCVEVVAELWEKQGGSTWLQFHLSRIREISNMHHGLIFYADARFKQLRSFSQIEFGRDGLLSAMSTVAARTHALLSQQMLDTMIEQVSNELITELKKRELQQTKYLARTFTLDIIDKAINELHENINKLAIQKDRDEDEALQEQLQKSLQLIRLDFDRIKSIEDSNGEDILPKFADEQQTRKFVTAVVGFAVDDILHRCEEPDEMREVLSTIGSSKSLKSMSSIKFNKSMESDTKEIVDNIETDAEIESSNSEKIKLLQHSLSMASINSSVSQAVVDAVLDKEKSIIDEIVKSNSESELQKQDSETIGNRSNLDSRDSNIRSGSALSVVSVVNESSRELVVHILDASVNRFKDLVFPICIPDATIELAMTSIPSSKLIHNFSTLLVLNISCNLLTSLHGIQACSSLEILDACDNLIDSIQPLLECHNLRRLRIAGNKLKSLTVHSISLPLPPNNIEMPALESDIAPSNKLFELLEYLDISDNDCSIDGMQNFSGKFLTHFEAKSCKLRNSCLDTLTQLTELQTLRLDNNIITDLRSVISHLKSLIQLRDLSFSGNPVQTAKRHDDVPSEHQKANDPKKKSTHYVVTIIENLNWIDILDHSKITKESKDQIATMRSQVQSEELLTKIESHFNSEMESIVTVLSDFKTRVETEESILSEAVISRLRKLNEEKENFLLYAKTKVEKSYQVNMQGGGDAAVSHEQLVQSLKNEFDAMIERGDHMSNDSGNALNHHDDLANLTRKFSLDIGHATGAGSPMQNTLGLSIGNQ